MLASYRARRTERLKSFVERVAFEISAESGARILSWCGITVSPDTLLRLVRDAPEPEPERETLRKLGVDDWAKKKGQSYGTILVDIERQRCSKEC